MVLLLSIHILLWRLRIKISTRNFDSNGHPINYQRRRDRKLMLLLSRMVRIVLFWLLLSLRFLSAKNLLIFLISHIIGINLFQNIVASKILWNKRNFIWFILSLIFSLNYYFIQILHPCLILFHHFLGEYRFFFLMEQTFNY